MTPPQVRVVQAEADARAARARLDGSLAALGERVRPATIVREVRRELGGVRTSAERIVGDNRRQARIGGGVAVALFLAIPLMRWRSRRRVAKRAARIRGA